MYQFSLEGLTPVKAEPYPFNGLQAMWLKELRSGKYKQGRGWLRDADDGYCCLGVLCELAGLKAIKRFQTSRAYEYNGNVGDLPAELVKAARFKDAMGAFDNLVRFPGALYGQGLPDYPGYGGHGSLASMNDAAILPIGGGKHRGFNFVEIASYIEFDAWNVFRAPDDIG